MGSIHSSSGDAPHTPIDQGVIYMSDSAVPRVLWALERVVAQLDALYDAEHAAFMAAERPPAGTPHHEYDKWMGDRCKSDGRAEGLAAAAQVARIVAQEYARKHSAVGGGHQARMLAALVEEQPADRSL